MAFALLSNPDPLILLRNDAQHACRVDSRVCLNFGSGERGLTSSGRSSSVANAQWRTNVAAVRLSSTCCWVSLENELVSSKQW